MVRIAIWMNLLIIFTEFVITPSGSTKTNGPSFDCNAAQYADEITICADQKLSKLDQIAAQAYSQMKGESKSITQDALLSLINSRHACKHNKLCILDTQVQVIQTLNENGAQINKPTWIGAFRLSLIQNGGTPMISGVPQKVGTCSRTKIKDIGTRWNDNHVLIPPKNAMDDNGTRIEYENGGVQISGSFNSGVAASRIGDQIILCLVSIPQDCPPDDDRGKVYSATNLRNQRSWIMTQTWHSCGGA